MTEKYVNKRWVDPSMKYDPVYLFENKPKKFEKLLRGKLSKQDSDSDENESETKKTS